MPAVMLTPPAGLPLDLAALRLHCRIDFDTEDSMLEIYLGAAVEYAQHATGRQFLAARLRYVTDGFPCHRRPLRLPAGPLIQVEAVRYLDSDGLEQTLAPTDYVVISAMEPTQILPAPGKHWPIFPHHWHGQVWVDFSAGYATPCTADSGADTLTVQGWPTLAVDDPVWLSNSGGVLPAPLEPGPYYIAAVVADNEYRFSRFPGGEPIGLTGTGTGTHYLGQPGTGHTGALPAGLGSWLLLRVAGLYEQRAEQTIVRAGSLAPLPFVDRLLDPYRIPGI